MKGTCKICNKKIKDDQYPTYLYECIDVANAVDNIDESDFYLLHIQDADVEKYWMFVGCVGSSTLADLDSFLGEKWLECCDHLSEFKINNRKIGMKQTIEQMHLKTCNKKGAIIPIQYDYDFGSTTTLFISIMPKHKKCIFEDDIFVLMENDPITFRCTECRKKATKICDSCINKVCDNCSQEHECSNIDYVDEVTMHDIYNSPRLGKCGYFGPIDENLIFQ